MKSAVALVLSIVAATIAPALLSAAIIALLSGVGDASKLAFYITALMALTHALVLGLPAVLLLRHHRLFRALPMTLAGGLIGCLPSATLWLPDLLPRDVSTYLGLSTLAFICGAAGGFAFLVVHRAVVPFVPESEAAAEPVGEGTSEPARRHPSESGGPS